MSPPRWVLRAGVAGCRSSPRARVGGCRDGRVDEPCELGLEVFLSGRRWSGRHCRSREHSARVDDERSALSATVALSPNPAASLRRLLLRSLGSVGRPVAGCRSVTAWCTSSRQTLRHARCRARSGGAPWRRGSEPADDPPFRARRGLAPVAPETLGVVDLELDSRHGNTQRSIAVLPLATCRRRRMPDRELQAVMAAP